MPNNKKRKQRQQKAIQASSNTQAVEQQETTQAFGDMQTLTAEITALFAHARCLDGDRVPAWFFGLFTKVLQMRSASFSNEIIHLVIGQILGAELYLKIPVDSVEIKSRIVFIFYRIIEKSNGFIEKFLRTLDGMRVVSSPETESQLPTLEQIIQNTLDVWGIWLGDKVDELETLENIEYLFDENRLAKCKENDEGIQSFLEDFAKHRGCLDQIRDDKRRESYKFKILEAEVSIARFRIQSNIKKIFCFTELYKKNQHAAKYRDSAVTVLRETDAIFAEMRTNTCCGQEILEESIRLLTGIRQRLQDTMGDPEEKFETVLVESAYSEVQPSFAAQEATQLSQIPEEKTTLVMDAVEAEVHQPTPEEEIKEWSISIYNRINETRGLFSDKNTAEYMPEIYKEIDFHIKDLFKILSKRPDFLRHVKNNESKNFCNVVISEVEISIAELKIEHNIKKINYFIERYKSQYVEKDLHAAMSILNNTEAMLVEIQINPCHEKLTSMQLRISEMRAICETLHRKKVRRGQRGGVKQRQDLGDQKNKVLITGQPMENEQDRVDDPEVEIPDYHGIMPSNNSALQKNVLENIEEAEGSEIELQNSGVPLEQEKKSEAKELPVESTLIDKGVSLEDLPGIDHQEIRWLVRSSGYEMAKAYCQKTLDNIHDYQAQMACCLSHIEICLLELRHELKKENNSISFSKLEAVHLRMISSCNLTISLLRQYLEKDL